MPATPQATAADEVGNLSALSRPELAALWVHELRAAHDRVGTSGRGRGGRWAAIGHDRRLREVEREFVRRLVEEAETRDEWDRHVATFGYAPAA